MKAVMIALLATLATLATVAESRREEDLSRCVFIVMSQPNKHHDKLASHLKDELTEKLSSLTDEPQILLLHRDFPSDHGAWTFLPILDHLDELYGQNANWFVFLQDFTRVNVPVLKKILEGYNPDDNLFIGHGLNDTTHTITHHFDNPGEIVYPDLGPGFVLSFQLVANLVQRLTYPELEVLGGYPKDFNIDPAYELAKFIHLSHEDPEEINEYNEIGPKLTHLPQFCLEGILSSLYFIILFGVYSMLN